MSDICQNRYFRIFFLTAFFGIIGTALFLPGGLGIYIVIVRTKKPTDEISVVAKQMSGVQYTVVSVEPFNPPDNMPNFPPSIVIRLRNKDNESDRRNLIVHKAHTDFVTFNSLTASNTLTFQFRRQPEKYFQDIEQFEARVAAHLRPVKRPPSST